MGFINSLRHSSRIVLVIGKVVVIHGPDVVNGGGRSEGDWHPEVLVLGECLAWWRKEVSSLLVQGESWELLEEWLLCVCVHRQRNHLSQRNGILYDLLGLARLQKGLSPEMAPFQVVEKDLGFLGFLAPL